MKGGRGHPARLVRGGRPAAILRTLKRPLPNSISETSTEAIATKINNLEAEVWSLKEYIKALEQSLLMRKASLLKEMAPPG